MNLKMFLLFFGLIGFSYAIQSEKMESLWPRRNENKPSNNHDKAFLKLKYAYKTKRISLITKYLKNKTMTVKLPVILRKETKVSPPKVKTAIKSSKDGNLMTTYINPLALTPTLIPETSTEEIPQRLSNTAIFHITSTAKTNRINKESLPPKWHNTISIQNSTPLSTLPIEQPTHNNEDLWSTVKPSGSSILDLLSSPTDSASKSFDPTQSFTTNQHLNPVKTSERTAFASNPSLEFTPATIEQTESSTDYIHSETTAKAQLISSSPNQKETETGSSIQIITTQEVNEMKINAVKEKETNLKKPILGVIGGILGLIILVTIVIVIKKRYQNKKKRNVDMNKKDVCYENKVFS